MLAPLPSQISRQEDGRYLRWCHQIGLPMLLYTTWLHTTRQTTFEKKIVKGSMRESANQLKRFAKIYCTWTIKSWPHPPVNHTAGVSFKWVKRKIFFICVYLLIKKNCFLENLCLTKFIIIMEQVYKKDIQHR